MIEIGVAPLTINAMKLFYALFVILMFNCIAKAQTNFNIGFKEGFKNGYCYSNNQSSYYCTPPLPPLPPLPQINESRNSYQDGYNQGMWYGQNQRKKDEYNSSNSAVKSNPPKFNPYVSQSPILKLSPEEREAYYASRARQNQESAEALGKLLEYIFEGTPEGRAKRAQKRAWNLEKKKIKAESEKYQKSVKSNNGNTSKKGNANITITTVDNNVNIIKKIEKNTKYFCVIYESDILNGKFEQKRLSEGYLIIKDNIVHFKNGANKWTDRGLINGVENSTIKTFYYSSEYGNIEIDYQNKEVRFYDESNKKCWTYKINKIVLDN